VGLRKQSDQPTGPKIRCNIHEDSQDAVRVCMESHEFGGVERDPWIARVRLPGGGVSPT